MNSIFHQAICLTAIIAAAITCKANDFQGDWKGHLDAGVIGLRIALHIEDSPDGGLKCLLDSPDQGAFGLPANARTSGDSISVFLERLALAYEGRMVGGKIEGTFRQGAFSTALTFERGTFEENRPQTPQPPFPYRSTEVTFTNAKDGTVLAGTLTAPAHCGNDPLPVVLLVSGSGQQNRDEEMFGHKPFWVIADYLARNGIASLRYDDRGAGASGGSADGITTAVSMEDAAAGIDYLRTNGQWSHVGCIGHSDGGSVAFMLAARGMADFAVTLAAPGVKGDSILMEQNRHALREAGLPAIMADSYCRALKGVLARLATPLPVADPEKEAARIAAEAGGSMPIPQPLVGNLAEMLRDRNEYITYFAAYDPAGDIAAARCPVLALGGSLDTQVESTANLSAIRRLLPKNGKNEVKEYAGLNHLFQHAETGSATEYAAIEETIAPEVLADIAKWISGLPKTTED